MRTKIRLALDLGIQLVLISILLLQIKSNPAETIQHLGVFAFLISIWQIFHAIYVVQKYQDWYRDLYLKKIKRIFLISILILGLAGSIAAITLGVLLPTVLQSIQVLGLGLSIILGALAFQYFGRSLVNLYRYYNRPRSFWDL
ncbi:hypothetical protein [Aureispira anguillae]|uniref:Uncharacterized protein n=1 Tax=Aureispira anguillae TaxID=2864201 RepID=A0A915YIW9_9BACT|nr:hypothetical protein [Aureispira anguillae]BDS14045.1 hypothetical protein AsAng_0048080 [Aureispira anguillae]